MSVPPAVRTRLLAAAAVAVAALALTGCRDGQGVRDEGPSTSDAMSLHHTGSPTAAPRPGCPQGQRVQGM
ncbi:hypothetical protein ACIHAA_27200 [Streptomyces sp. NPDC052040]|uniref:hypothetical protein n=1 Tax=unclassified Streptomyces TaxID=2593676 RepID=UPI0037D213BF